MNRYLDIASSVVNLGYAIFKWWSGTQVEKELRAKEIYELLSKVSSDGQKLSYHLVREMRSHGYTDWDDIHTRDDDGSKV